MSSDWTAHFADGREVHWSPSAPHLAGDARLVAALRDLLDLGGSVEVSPVGPYLDPSEADSLAVFTLLNRIATPAAVTGDQPEPPQPPPDAVS